MWGFIKDSLVALGANCYHFPGLYHSLNPGTKRAPPIGNVHVSEFKGIKDCQKPPGTLYYYFLALDHE